MKSFDEIYALATAAPHSELAETFTDPRLSWGVGVTQGVAVAMQEAQAEIERLKVGHDRYETLRTLNPRQFADLYAESIKSGVAFDDLVDGLGCNREQTN